MNSKWQNYKIKKIYMQETTTFLYYWQYILLFFWIFCSYHSLYAWHCFPKARYLHNPERIILITWILFMIQFIFLIIGTKGNGLLYHINGMIIRSIYDLDILLDNTNILNLITNSREASNYKKYCYTCWLS